MVVLRPNKADLGSPALGQGVVYRLKVILTLKYKDGRFHFLVLIYAFFFFGRES